MRNWKRLALATAIGIGASTPLLAAESGASGYNQQGNGVATPAPLWDNTQTGMQNGTTALPDTTPLPGALTNAPIDANVPPSMNGPHSAAEESRATGHVDAQRASPPRTGSDVQAGDMGPSSPKGQ